MTTSSSAYLVKVSGKENNNKFYAMQQVSTSQFEVTYGRVGTNGVKKVYPINKWDNIYYSKVKKGYKPQAQTTQKVDFTLTGDPEIDRVLSHLQENSRQLVAKNYSIDPGLVTKKQIKEAQDLINQLWACSSVSCVNHALESLFTTLPRKMKKVSDHFILDMNELQDLVQQEQDLLDAMKTQVVQPINNNSTTIPESYGFKIKQIAVNTITHMLRGRKPVIHDYDGVNIKANIVNVFEVNKTEQDKAFDSYINNADNKKTRLMWHGSRDENWLSIISSKLLLSPNAQIAGKLFGNGIYFANNPMKSVGYTSLAGSAWSKGSRKRAFLALYEVHSGNMHNETKSAKQWMMSSTAGSQLQAKGYDSLMVRRGTEYQGVTLKNDEMIVYNEDQARIKYLVEIEIA